MGRLKGAPAKTRKLFEELKPTVTTSKTRLDPNYNEVHTTLICVLILSFSPWYWTQRPVSLCYGLAGSFFLQVMSMKRSHLHHKEILFVTYGFDVDKRDFNDWWQRRLWLCFVIKFSSTTDTCVPSTRPACLNYWPILKSPHRKSMGKSQQIKQFRTDLSLPQTVIEPMILSAAHIIAASLPLWLLMLGSQAANAISTSLRAPLLPRARCRSCPAIWLTDSFSIFQITSQARWKRLKHDKDVHLPSCSQHAQWNSHRYLVMVLSRWLLKGKVSMNLNQTQKCLKTTQSCISNLI